MKTKTNASRGSILALLLSVSLCLCGEQAAAQAIPSGSTNHGTITPAPQYSIPCYLTVGTTKILTACANITTDVNGNLIINSSGAAFVQTEIADPGAPGAAKGSLYFNNAYHRGMLYNNNAGPKAVGTWGVTTVGGLQVGGSSVINGINTEVLVGGNTSGTAMLTEDASGNATWSAIGTIPSSAGLTSNGTSTLVYDTTAETCTDRLLAQTRLSSAQPEPWH